MAESITDRATLLAYNQKLLNSYFQFYDGLSIVFPETHVGYPFDTLGVKSNEDFKAEVLSRVFLLAVPVVNNDRAYLVRGTLGTQYYLLDVLRNWISLACDPSSKLYLKPGAPNGQMTLEACYLSLSILATESSLRFVAVAKLKTWLLSHLNTTVHKNNWSVAKLGLTMLLSERFLLSSSELALVKSKEAEAYAVLHASYLGRGWYLDGANVDYYSAWSMIWWLCQSKARSRSSAPIVSGCSTDLVVYQFLRAYELLFDAQGRSPEWGRSSCYRFAAVSPIAAAAESGSIPAEDLGRLKDVLLENVNAFANTDILDAHGLLTLDFAGAGSKVDFYSSYASPLWAAKAFWALNLKDDSAFWQAERVPKPKVDYYVQLLDKLDVGYSSDDDVVTLSSGYKLTTVDGSTLDDPRYDSVRSTNW